MLQIQQPPTDRIVQQKHIHFLHCQSYCRGRVVIHGTIADSFLDHYCVKHCYIQSLFRESFHHRKLLTIIWTCLRIFRNKSAGECDRTKLKIITEYHPITVDVIVLVCSAEFLPKTSGSMINMIMDAWYLWSCQSASCQESRNSIGRSRVASLIMHFKAFFVHSLNETLAFS